MTPEARNKRFFNWAFGLFIHYGLYSVYGRGEWIIYKERMKPEEYRNNALPHFHPEPGTTRKWLELAKSCGMKYAVLTTRHHDGFFIGDSIVREYCDACHELGLGCGLYYSVADWTNPDYFQGTDGKHWWRFVQKSHRQIKELMTGYGKIDYLFYDGTPPPDTWDIYALHKEIRSLQPDLLICRGRADFDVKSCEGNSDGRADGGLWESCYTFNDSWGYNAADENWKSAPSVAEMLFANRHNGGNFLLNIGPRADGSLQTGAERGIRALGDWVNVNAEALYDIVPHPFQYADQELSTGRGDKAYIMLTHEQYGPERRITGIGNRVSRIAFLDDGSPLEFRQKDDVIQLTGLVPRKIPGMPRILKLELDGSPVGVKNYMTPNLAMKFEGDREE